MPEKLDRCVEHVMAQGKPESNAYAICQAALYGKSVPDGTGNDELVELQKLFGETNVEKTVEASDKFSIFIPITKIDLEQRQVWGIANEEKPDNANEIMDYATSKPYILEWSTQAEKRSGGKSKGNVRAMHQLVAAGKLIDLQAIDEDKAFYVGAQVVDDDEWLKVQEGVYTGFSVGGHYVKRWPDRQYIRYTAKPSEISLVDVPCLPSATFDVVKADGVEQRAFQQGEGQEKLDLVIESVEELEKDDATPAPAQVEPAVIAQSVSGQAYEQVQPQQRPIEIDNPDNSPTTQQIENANGPPVDLTTMAKPVVTKQQSTPTGQVGKKAKIIKNRSIKVKKQKSKKKFTFTKDDVTNLVEGAHSMVASLQEQAANGEVDQALLDQVGAALEIAADYVEDMESEVEGEISPTASELGESSVETKVEVSPSAPSESPSSPSPSSPSPSPSSPSPSPSDSSPSPSLSKTDGDGPAPMPMRPPEFMIMGQGEDELMFRVPAFTKAMMNNNLREAEHLAYNSQATFDKMFSMACHRCLDEMGFTSWQAAQGGLMKAIAAAGMPGINLLPLARLMYPVYAGLSRRLPAQPPDKGAVQSTWRANLGFGALAVAQFLRVVEGAVGPAMAENFLTFNAPYCDVSVYDQVTLKATAASRGFDDPLQVAVIGSLAAVLQGRERSVLGRNAAVVATPAQPVAALGVNPGILADDTYTVTITALTYDGWLTPSTGGALAVGETVGSVASAALVIFGGGGLASIDVTFACVPGAVAYNIYCNGAVTTGGLDVFVGQTTVPIFTITTVAGAGNAPPVADTTVNAAGYEGLIEWAELSPIYGNVIPAKVGATVQGITDNGGAQLTPAGSGIAEFDAILTTLWTTWQIVPTLILCSPQSISHYTRQIMTLAQPQYRINLNNVGDQSTVIGGAMVTSYASKFGHWADGQKMIEMMAHPYMPDSTFLFLTESVPYPMSRDSRGIALETLIPFTYFPLPAQAAGVPQIIYPFTVTHSETVQCFHPSVQTALVGVSVP